MCVSPPWEKRKRYHDRQLYVSDTMVGVGRIVRRLGAYVFGLLLFMIGVSVFFESVVLGLFFAGSSLFFLPESRAIIREAFGVQAPPSLLVVVLVAGLVTPSLLFEDYETGTYFGADGEVQIRVTYDDAWEGELDTWNSYSRLGGGGNATIAVRDNHGTIDVSANKTATTAGTLRLSVLVGGDIVASDTAGPGERQATLEYDLPIL